MKKKKKRKKKGKEKQEKTCITSLHIYSCVYTAPKTVVQLFGSSGKTGTVFFVLVFLAGKERGRGCGLINVNQYLIRCMNVAQITISRGLAFSLSAISFQKVNPVGVNCESPEKRCQCRVLISLALL